MQVTHSLGFYGSSSFHKGGNLCDPIPPWPLSLTQYHIFFNVSLGLLVIVTNCLSLFCCFHLPQCTYFAVNFCSTCYGRVEILTKIAYLYNNGGFGGLKTKKVCRLDNEIKVGLRSEGKARKAINL